MTAVTRARSWPNGERALYYQQIAEVVGCPIGTVRSRLQKALWRAARQRGIIPTAAESTEPEGRHAVIVMDRENAVVRGWSHVLSTTNDLAELEQFRERVGAPPQALHLGNRRWPHLDLKLEPRERALADPAARVFERTADMLRFVKALRAVAPPTRGPRAP